MATTAALIPLEHGDVQATLRTFLRRLLETGLVQALLVPLETPAGSITPALVTDPALLARAVPLPAVLGLNVAPLAGAVSRQTATEATTAPIGVVLRPCEQRALVELAKLQQADLARLLTIGLDCPGSCDVPTYTRLRAAGGVRVEALLAAALGSAPTPPGFALRPACAMCERPQAEGATVTVGLFGAAPPGGLPVWLPQEHAERLELVTSEDDGSARRRSEAIARLVAARSAARDAQLAEIEARLAQEGIAGVLAACVRCHNCMTACPICYCRTCLFRSPTFEHDGATLLARARRKGAYRLPADTMLFHLTRLHHMALSCVGCGMCTSACPAELPVGSVFRAVGVRLQELFEYVPGRSVDEALPLVTFREDEWSELGEE